jgi:hypothetical protein
MVPPFHGRRKGQFPGARGGHPDSFVRQSADLAFAAPTVSCCGVRAGIPDGPAAVEPVSAEGGILGIANFSSILML